MSQTAYGTPLVGRDEELTRLVALLERARAGEARAVLVSGDAGVGKTRLLTEASARAADAGMTVLTGHCVDLGDVGLPYLPVTEILAAVAADERFAPVLAGHPAVDRLLGSGPAAPLGGDGRLQFFEDTAGLLADLADAAPVLLVFEDLHWADQSTRDLLRFLLSRAVLQRPGAGPGQRLAVCASYRSDDLHRRHPLRPLLAELVRLPAVERLDVRPMDDGQVAGLVRALRPGQLAEETVRRIVERAEGNAFYAEELLAATADGPPGEAVPSGLADVLLIRFEQLSDTAQDVLRTAAVAGRRVDHGLLSRAAGIPEEELEEALREAVGRQLLVAREGDTYAFRHALIGEAVYADLLPGERVRLHGVFARLLAASGRPADAAERAHHARESHDLPGALAASLQAADHAQRVGAPAEELRHLETVLDLWPVVEQAGEVVAAAAPEVVAAAAPEEAAGVVPAAPAGSEPDAAAPSSRLDEVTLTLRASAAAVRAGESHRAVSLSRAALARVGPDADSDLAARVRYTLAGSLMRTDNLEAAFEYSSEAVAMIPADPPSQTWVWAAATHVMAAGYVGDPDTALAVARKAVRVAEELGVGDAQADLLISLVGLEGDNRRTEAGRERLRQARELARRAGNSSIELRAIFNLAIGCFEAGALDECLPWLEDGLEVARRTGLLSAPYPLELRYLRFLVLYTLGRWDECLRAAGADAEKIPPAGAFATGPALYVALGRGEESAEAGARALVERPYDWMAELVAGIVLTDAAALRGDAEEAVARCHQAVKALSGTDGARPDVTVRLAALALAAVADTAAEARLTGDTAAAARWAETAAELADMARELAVKGEDGTQQGAEGAAWLARAEAEATRAAGRADDVEAWQRAVTAFGYGDVYEQARGRRRLAEALLAADRREEAGAEARRARETAARLGARPLLDAVDALIRRGRLAASGAPPAAGGPLLTARERDVLLLLARGRTNRQIGEELFISGKTASVHVSNILAKLSAGSRTEAVAIAYREGLIEAEEAGRG